MSGIKRPVCVLLLAALCALSIAALAIRRPAEGLLPEMLAPADEQEGVALMYVMDASEALSVMRELPAGVGEITVWTMTPVLEPEKCQVHKYIGGTWYVIPETEGKSLAANIDGRKLTADLTALEYRLTPGLYRMYIPQPGYPSEFCEFVVGTLDELEPQDLKPSRFSPDNGRGASLTVDMAGKVNAGLIRTTLFSENGESFVTGCGGYIEIELDGKWYELPGDPAFEQVAYVAGQGAPYAELLNFGAYSVAPVPGHYRAVKELWPEKSGVADKFCVSGEFDVTELSRKPIPLSENVTSRASVGSFPEIGEPCIELSFDSVLDERADMLWQCLQRMENGSWEFVTPGGPLSGEALPGHLHFGLSLPPGCTGISQRYVPQSGMENRRTLLDAGGEYLPGEYRVLSVFATASGNLFYTRCELDMG